MEYLEKINMIIRWATSCPGFDSTYIDSVFKQASNGNEISSRQEIAIDNIIRSFRIKDQLDTEKIVNLFQEDPDAKVVKLTPIVEKEKKRKVSGMSFEEFSPT